MLNILSIKRSEITLDIHFLYIQILSVPGFKDSCFTVFAKVFATKPSYSRTHVDLVIFIFLLWFCYFYLIIKLCLICSVSIASIISMSIAYFNYSNISKCASIGTKYSRKDQVKFVEGSL